MKLKHGQLKPEETIERLFGRTIGTRKSVEIEKLIESIHVLNGADMNSPVGSEFFVPRLPHFPLFALLAIGALHSPPRDKTKPPKEQFIVIAYSLIIPVILSEQ